MNKTDLYVLRELNLEPEQILTLEELDNKIISVIEED